MQYSRRWVLIALAGILPLSTCCAEDPAAAALREGQRLLREYEYKQALEAFSRSLELQPAQPEALLHRGDLYAHMGRYSRAIADYTAAVAAPPKSVEALARRAYCYRTLRMHAAALDDCQAALRIRPDDPQILSLRASLFYDKEDYLRAGDDSKRLVLYDADWSTANTGLAHALFAARRYREAIATYDRMLLQAPRDTTALYWGGAALLEIGEADRAVARFQELLLADPAQGGGYSRRWPLSRPLSPEDFAHGRRQVERLLKDRPWLAQHTAMDEELCQWAVQKFAGEDVPGRMVWDPATPTADADHQPPEAGKSARIRLRELPYSKKRLAEDTTASFEDQWSSLAYELHNVQSHARFAELDELAASGDLSREGYVREMARLEYHALQRTRSWYLDCFRPWARRKGLSSDPRLWRLDTPLTFSEFMDRYADRNSYPWVPYAAHYDKWAELRGRSQQQAPAAPPP